MTRTFKYWLASAFVSVTLALSGASSASPVTVTYDVTGTSGNWVLDFSVANNINASQSIYFFGVDLSARDIVASPGAFNPNQFSTWNNCPYGGSCTTIYDNIWINGSIGYGTTLSGFKVHVTDLAAPTNVAWYSYASGGTSYTGADCNHCGTNPGFSGTASNAAAVPEPGTIALFGLGLFAVGALRRKSA